MTDQSAGSGWWVLVAIVGQLMTFATVIVGQWLNHRWQLEERAASAAAAHAQIAATLAGRDSAAVVSGARLEAAIAENTAISQAAFHEANTVNAKLEKLGLSIKAAGRE